MSEPTNDDHFIEPLTVELTARWLAEGAESHEARNDALQAALFRRAEHVVRALAARSAPAPEGGETRVRFLAALQNYEMVACALDVLGASELGDAERSVIAAFDAALAAAPRSGDGETTAELAWALTAVVALMDDDAMAGVFAALAGPDRERFATVIARLGDRLTSEGAAQ